jgi:acyl dehydratase
MLRRGGGTGADEEGGDGTGAPRAAGEGGSRAAAAAADEAPSTASGEATWEAGEERPDPLPRGAVWRLPGDLGRRYAGVSGDRNPIHMHALSAKLFGFPRAIAHGMWTQARCLAALEQRLPDGFSVAVEFRKPILLPGEVAFAEAEQDGAIRFAVTRSGREDRRNGRDDRETRHLDGRVEPLAGGTTVGTATVTSEERQERR